MLDRRRLLGGAATAAALASLPALAQARAKTTPAAAPVPAAPAQSDPAEAAKLNALMDEFMQRLLRRSPETTTGLGLDKGDLAWTKSAFSDESLAATAQDKDINTDELRRLREVKRSALAGMDVVNYDTVEFSLEVQEEGNRKFDYGGQGAGAPYILSQLTGDYQSVPDFLDNQHVIETKADADAYLARIEGLGRQMDQELEIARHDAALGVIPPDFVIDKALTQMRTLGSQTTQQCTIVSSLVRRTKEKGIAGDWAGQASKLYDETFRPALARQVALMEGWRPKAVHDAGCWRLPKGDEYYAVSLKQDTTSTMSPDEVHQTGLDLVASLSAQMDTIMKAKGMTQGSVGQRLRAMYDDPKYRYPNTDEGKEKLIADLNEKVKAISARLPPTFGALPKTPLEIHRVPKAIEAGAPGGYYNPGSLDGTRPGIYWINLRDTAEVPSWTLPTLTYHEGIPGHHLQLTLANEAKGLPMLRKVLGNGAYGEGWALYAEQLAVEMGMYDKDPLGHIGQLHDACFRAVRLVVDSGLHAKKWSREQAIKYAVDALGDKESSLVTEIERYCVWPGQACGYMLGKLTFLKLRDKARQALGKRFDIRAFHDVLLLSGNMPLSVMERRVDDFIAAQQKA
jgi:uncharacterized protein (DUF885 family)